MSPCQGGGPDAVYLQHVHSLSAATIDEFCPDQRVERKEKRERDAKRQKGRSPG